MIDIIVERYEGDKDGGTILVPLTGSIPVALARGRFELNEHAQAMVPMTMEAIYRDGVRLGMFFLVRDSRAGESFMTKVVGITHSYRGIELTTTLRLRRVAN
jgi:hypothetical protein